MTKSKSKKSASDVRLRLKNAPKGRDTEINEHAPKHPAPYVGEDTNALGLQSLPQHMRENDDENLIDERLVRRGAGDRGGEA